MFPLKTNSQKIVISYRDIFNNKFNLSFKLPGLSTCDDSGRYNRQLKETELSATDREE